MGCIFTPHFFFIEDMYIREAFNILAKSATDYGFLATAKADENYNRVWSRDSAIAAIAVLVHQYKELYPTIKKSIQTLGNNQLDNGLIPSNVGISEDGNLTVSYGTLVGRVDAQTWWIIQSCLYLKTTNDVELKNWLSSKVLKTIQLLENWEFNARHLVYTPLGGNWADEYVLSGYTLYDNLLRLLALKLAQTQWPEFGLEHKIETIHQAILANYHNSSQGQELQIHPIAKKRWNAKNMSYLPAAFDAAGYFKYWDAAANGLALLLDLGNDTTIDWIEHFCRNQEVLYPPAYWPVIEPTDPDWSKLELQYNYAFKNQPYHFHNGGSWPVMTGLIGLGLTKQNNQDLTEQIRLDYEKFLLQIDEFAFSEYISINDRKPGGKKEMCFSASGYLFLCTTQIQLNNLFDL